MKTMNAVPCRIITSIASFFFVASLRCVSVFHAKVDYVCQWILLWLSLLLLQLLFNVISCIMLCCVMVVSDGTEFFELFAENCVFLLLLLSTRPSSVYPSIIQTIHPLSLR